MNSVAVEKTKTAFGVRAALSLMPENSQVAKAARLGCSVQTLYRWCSGAASPSEQSLARLARCAGVEQEWIRRGGIDE
ncbi:helix-turn-helix transcriptional regulator [Pseudonocardia sp. NPDC049635]|uniref:helix-turn-helix domain-containing protein n=1 Tax=Pseudonocardia sp. NPDC049635 TaxID=3155506 RepID=UPI003407612C